MEKNYYYLNRQKRLEYQREYNRKNYDKIKEYNHDYFLKKKKNINIVTNLPKTSNVNLVTFGFKQY